MVSDMLRFDAKKVTKKTLKLVEGIVIGLEPNYLKSVSGSAVSILLWVRSVL